MDRVSQYPAPPPPCVPVVTLCRRGNDSQRAAQLLQRHLAETPEFEVRDIRGGLYAWKEQVDPTLLLY